VIRWCDCVAMDFKPASMTGARNFDRQHERFSKLPAKRKSM